MNGSQILFKNHVNIDIISLFFSLFLILENNSMDLERNDKTILKTDLRQILDLSDQESILIDEA